MFKLRQTWNDVFPQMKLYAIDVQIHQIDPAWPVTAQPSNSIHLNPKFLKNTVSCFLLYKNSTHSKNAFLIIADNNQSQNINSHNRYRIPSGTGNPEQARN